MKSLVARLLAVGLAQLVVLALLAVGIAYVTMPTHGGPGPDHPAHHDQRPDHTYAGNPSPPFAVGPLLTLLAGVLVIGAGAYLTGRWIVAPLGVLARAARRIAEGELGTRTGLTRSDELGEVARAFDHMSERVQALLAAERRMLADISHELRTPLARIHVAVDLAVEGDHEAARAALADIAIDLAELEKLVDDVLTASRLGEHAALKPAALAPIRSAELAAWAEERFRTRHPKRPLEVDVQAEGTVNADAALLRRALDNLLDNAHKYTDDIGTPVRLHALATESHCVFEVIDHGRGIAVADLPNVVKPFFRTDASRSRTAGGVGLGLTIATRIVESHGGTLEVESTLGSGTCVRIALPRSA